MLYVIYDIADHIADHGECASGPYMY